MKTLFVYGTLKRGGSNHAFLADQRFVGAARTAPGYTLYELDGYPGMIVDATDEEGVTGELWEVDDKVLSELDRLEGVDEGLYRRLPVPLASPPAAERPDSYVFARPVARRRRLGPTWPV